MGTSPADFPVYYSVNTFTPEPPLFKHVPSTTCDAISFIEPRKFWRQTCDEMFQAIPKWARLSDTGQRKFQWKSGPTTHSYFRPKNFKILGLLAKSFRTKRSLVNSQQKKQKRGNKSERSREERKRKVRDEGAGKVVICHQERKLVYCSTCKRCLGQFRFFLARQWPKNGLTRFKRQISWIDAYATIFVPIANVR